MMADHVCGDDDEATTRQELEHSRVPCFHAHCRCDTKLPNSDDHPGDHPRAHHPRRHGRHVVHREPHRYDGDHDADPHHNHHHIHHHHHHHHNELHSSSSSSSSPRVTTARSFQVGSLHRLLTLFVFLLAWAAVCGAPRRTSDGSLSRYNPETEHTNSLFFDHDSSHPMAAISSVEALLQPPRRPSKDENAKDTTARATASTAASTSSSASLKTGSEPAMRVNANSVRSPLDSMNMPGIFPGFVSQRVAFSVERPHTPPWPGDISFKPHAIDEEGASANTTDESEVAHSRRRRSSSISDLEEVCESTSGWVVKKWGTDMYGQNVTILSEIMTAGNIQVTQWFYETACARPHGVQTCLGIDNNNYESLCLTKSAWVYAMIRTARGEEGWTWIAISSSCNCAVRRLSILEQMQRRRLTRLEGFR